MGKGVSKIIKYRVTSFMGNPFRHFMFLEKYSLSDKKEKKGFCQMIAFEAFEYIKRRIVVISWL